MPSIAVTTTNNTSLNGSQITMSVVGTGTAFTATPFTLSGGDATIVSQAVTNATHGTIVVNAGTTSGTLTVTDTISSQTATIAVNVVTTTDPQAAEDRYQTATYSYATITEASGVTTIPLGQISNVSALRVHYVTKGASSTAVLKGSMDGSNWYTLQTPASGINAVLSVCDKYAKIEITNASGSDPMTDLILITSRTHA